MPRTLSVCEDIYRDVEQYKICVYYQYNYPWNENKAAFGGYKSKLKTESSDDLFIFLLIVRERGLKCVLIRIRKD